MGKYKVRKLYQTSSTAGPNHTAYESTWAYTIEYENSTNPVPGRFRIRVTKLPAAEYVAMMGGDPSEFEGGDLVFDEKGQTIKLQQGQAIFFASFMRHRVAPVKKGIRRSMVMWFGGPSLK